MEEILHFFSTDTGKCVLLSCNPAHHNRMVCPSGIHGKAGRSSEDFVKGIVINNWTCLSLSMWWEYIKLIFLFLRRVHLYCMHCKWSSTLANTVCSSGFQITIFWTDKIHAISLSFHIYNVALTKYFVSSCGSCTG